MLMSEANTPDSEEDGAVDDFRGSVHFCLILCGFGSSASLSPLPNLPYLTRQMWQMRQMRQYLPTCLGTEWTPCKVAALCIRVIVLKDGWGFSQLPFAAASFFLLFAAFPTLSGLPPLSLSLFLLC
ncbi:hypothetical protein Vafri_5549 [Volvox africanus]|uniref:Uncharacterized protein n=1 Tax=Volvox africanus TaxID=51714 RepID=A0A8J4AXG0_9CHLO|nr:hypothetical protein Vafri_5549 [Volvox africanus]